MTQILHKQQLGLTLIEMMISMVISLVLVLGVVSIYITSKRGFTTNDSVSQQQENARFSADFLLHDLRMAGYSSYPKDPALAAVSTAVDGGGIANDSITLQYISATDCLGQATPANSCLSQKSAAQNCAINTYSIDANNNLVCLGNGGPNPGVIADNVTHMQILYGIDISNDCGADKYVRWGNVADPTQIVSVRIAFLSQTPTDSTGNAATNTYTLLDQSITLTDKRLHRVYANTVRLRNVNPSFTKQIDCPI